MYIANFILCSVCVSLVVNVSVIRWHPVALAYGLGLGLELVLEILIPPDT